MKKKFRNEKGQLTVKLDEIGKLTQKTANSYYRVGRIYLNHMDDEEYVFIAKDEVVVHFQSFSGKNLFIPLDSLGTFLPDIASEGMELEFVE